MKTSLNLASKEPNGKKNQKTITDINPAADGNALKTFAQGLNNLTTNTYIGSTKINIDTLSDELDDGSNPLPAPKIYVGTMTDSSTFGGYTKLAVGNYKAQWTTKLPIGGVYLLTSSTGRVSAVSYPAATGALARYRGQTEEGNKKPYSPAAPSADIIADLGETPRYWNLTCPVPDPDNPDCLGKFVFVIDATDTHSSVTLTINVTGVE